MSEQCGLAQSQGLRGARPGIGRLVYQAAVEHVDLPRAEAVALLKERTRRIEAWRSSVTEHYVP
ncbi:hypothetical protein AB0C13_39095, partial [Streptomyces sp. NPDC049099]